METMHPDLVRYVHFSTIHHPLVIGIVTSNNSRINLIYEQKKIARSKARASGDWKKYIFLYERPFRLDALLKAAKNGLRKSPSEFWALMGRVWIDTETARRHPIKWRRLWDEPIEGQRSCMAEEDLCIFDSLPEQIVVWRGASHKRGLAGFSWTMDQEKAAFFARRFCSQSRVPEGRALLEFCSYAATSWRDICILRLEMHQDLQMRLPSELRKQFHSLIIDTLQYLNDDQDCGYVEERLTCSVIPCATIEQSFRASFAMPLRGFGTQRA
jgi:hypothetical protein